MVPENGIAFFNLLTEAAKIEKQLKFHVLSCVRVDNFYVLMLNQKLISVPI